MDPNHCPDALQLDSRLMTAVAARCEEGTRGSGTLRTQSTGPAVWPAFVAEISHLRLGGLFAFPIQIGVLLVDTLSSIARRRDPCLVASWPPRWTPGRRWPGVVLGIAASSATEEVVPQYRLAVRQAAGMLTVHLAVSIEEAMVRLRARIH